MPRLQAPERESPSVRTLARANCGRSSSARRRPRRLSEPTRSPCSDFRPRTPQRGSTPHVPGRVGARPCYFVGSPSARACRRLRSTRSRPSTAPKWVSRLQNFQHRLHPQPEPRRARHRRCCRLSSAARRVDRPQKSVPGTRFTASVQDVGAELLGCRRRQILRRQRLARGPAPPRPHQTRQRSRRRRPTAAEREQPRRETFAARSSPGEHSRAPAGPRPLCCLHRCLAGHAWVVALLSSGWCVTVTSARASVLRPPRRDGPREPRPCRLDLDGGWFGR